MGIQLISEHEGIIMKVIVFDQFMTACMRLKRSIKHALTLLHGQ